MSELMTMDHQLVRSDFIGVAWVNGDNQLIVEDVWATRWGLEEGAHIGVDTRAHLRFSKAGARYLFLLKGDTWEKATLTHGRHSLFSIQRDGTMHCDDGTMLYSAAMSGFLCSTPALVWGTQKDEPALRAEVLLRLGRARKRLPELAMKLDEAARPLAPRDPGSVGVTP
jgi:hypothetical protein